MRPYLSGHAASQGQEVPAIDSAVVRARRPRARRDAQHVHRRDHVAARPRPGSVEPGHPHRGHRRRQGRQRHPHAAGPRQGAPTSSASPRSPTHGSTSSSRPRGGLPGRAPEGDSRLALILLEESGPRRRWSTAAAPRTRTSGTSDAFLTRQITTRRRHGPAAVLCSGSLPDVPLTLYADVVETARTGAASALRRRRSRGAGPSPRRASRTS